MDHRTAGELALKAMLSLKCQSSKLCKVVSGQVYG